MPLSIPLEVSVSMFPPPSLPILTARSVVELVLCGWGAAQGTVLGCVLPSILWPLIRTEGHGCPVLQKRAAAFFSKVPGCGRGCKFDSSPGAGSWMLGYTWVPRPRLIMELFLLWTWLRGFHYHINRLMGVGSSLFPTCDPRCGTSWLNPPQGSEDRGHLCCKRHLNMSKNQSRFQIHQFPPLFWNFRMTQSTCWVPSVTEILWPWPLHVQGGKLMDSFIEGLNWLPAAKTVAGCTHLKTCYTEDFIIILKKSLSLRSQRNCRDTSVGGLSPMAWHLSFFGCRFLESKRKSGT